jgi:hypothetical protein
MITTTRYLILVIGLGATVQAQIVRDMSADRIREAIAIGNKAKDLGAYRIQEKARWSWPPLIGFYTTPFLRVALAANTAKRHYKQFVEADVTPEMLAPEIQVYAPSQAAGGAEIANVETIVLMPNKSKDTSLAIQPRTIADATEEYKNLFGFSSVGKGKLAVFPIEVWQESTEIHVVFDHPVPSSQGPGKMGGCTDCKSRIYLDKIR